MVAEHTRPSAPWLTGLVVTALVVGVALSTADFELDAPVPWLAVAAPGVALFAWSSFASRRTGSRRSGTASPRFGATWRAAFAAGAAAGILVGIAAAQATPTKWTMTDIAWHSAKIARAADGRVLEDPILEDVETIYPFVFHLVLSWPVKLGLSVRWVLWAATPISLALFLFAFWRFVAAAAGEARAAVAATALPLVFYSPLNAFILLGNPFNASLGVVFAGLALLARAEDESDRRRLAASGFALGLAGMLWYGHLPWIALAVAGWSLGRVRLARWIAIGAAPWVVVLALHLARLASRGTLGASAFNPGAVREPALERAAGLARNLLSLSGATPLSEAPFWIGTLVAASIVAALLRGLEAPTPWKRTTALALATVCVVLAWAGLRFTFWQPFAWRYAFLVHALLVAAVACARPWSVGGRELGPIHLLALAALVWAPRTFLPRVLESRRLERQFEHGAADVARFLGEHTAADEPVFASFDTWDLAIAIGAPRPNLVARNGGVHNFAPAAIAAPRWRDYERITSSTDAREIAALLAPYGFTLSVISERDLERPGFRTLANGFETIFQSAPYRVVDLARPR